MDGVSPDQRLFLSASSASVFEEPGEAEPGFPAAGKRADFQKYRGIRELSGAVRHEPAAE